MSRRKTQIALITRWLAHPREGRNEWDWDYLGHEGLHRTGITISRTSIYEGDGATTLAIIIRPQSEHDSGLIRMVLPNPLTIGRHRLIVRLAREAGWQTVTVPGHVLNAADIRTTTIEVIDTGRSRGLRASEQLITAETAAPWSRRTRKAFFLSGYDRNEPGLRYFLCELPSTASPTTVAEAYEALKPEAVKQAEKMGLRVRRQGDIFFVPLRNLAPTETSDAQKAGHYLLGTNHLGTQVGWKKEAGVILTYARGRIRHAPIGRRADHKTLHLGRRWHLVVKNTVPISR